MAHSSWGSGWPDCNGGLIDSSFEVDGTRFPGGVRYELVDLCTRLVRETKSRGYLFGTDDDPSYGCWGYSCRCISGSSSPSNHSWGLALDINAPSNPYTSPLVTDMPDWMPELWNEYGFRWGGDYSGSQDAMHYEFMGSVSDAANETARAQANGIGGTPSQPEDWFDTVTKDEMTELLQPIIDQVNDIQARVRGTDTGPGQRHEHYDMLQGIDRDTADAQARLRGTDPNVDALQRLSMDHGDIRNDIAAALG